MKRMSGRKLITSVCGMLGLWFLVADTSAGSHKEHPYRYSVVDVPVSLAVGTVRTPEFSPRKTSWHWIMVQVEEPFPPLQMRCMMGTTLGPLDSKNCPSDDPLLRADWTVWEGEHVVAQGSNEDNCACKFDDKHIFRFLGKFPALSGKKYVLEVKFTKDGTPLNVANPHLIVTKIGEE
jgi:hypothetical protein